MKSKFIKGIILGVACAWMTSGTVKAQAFTQNFDDMTSLVGSGWTMTNASSPLGFANWMLASSIVGIGPFDSYNGAPGAYMCAFYNSTTGSTGTISNWLLTPNRTFRNGDVITFYTRKAAPDDYPDRLEVRLSTNGTSANVGSGAGVGDYNTLLLSVNPTLVTGVYPTTWTQYTITISGLPAPTSGRIGFRYYVTNAGPMGVNSEWIGIDNVVYTPYACPTFTMTTSGALAGGTAGSAYSTTLTQTGALGAPNYVITAGSLPPGLTLSASGTISGTPTAAGTFNFTVMVGDASGCTGSSSYSITVVCPTNPITFAPIPELCDNAGVYSLTEASPAGGIYSGTGVTGNNFDPAAGTQTITYDFTDPYGCPHSQNAIITVNLAPAVSLTLPVTEICVTDAAVMLSGGTPAGGNYSGAGVAGGNFDPATAGVGSHPVTYTYTDVNGCSDQSIATILVGDCAGVEEGSSAQFSVYPNPSSGVFTISGNTLDMTVLPVVVDLSGREVNAFAQSNGSEWKIDLSGKPEGVYFVSVMSNGKQIRMKLEKMK